jgi:hypothetical protein
MSKLKGFGIFGIAMVLGLMAMMVPSAVLADDDEGPIRLIRACLAPPCQEGNGVVIQLDDGSSYRVCFIGHEGNTWTYFVQEVCALPTKVEDPRFLSDVTIPDFIGICGKDLSHWALGLEKCLIDKVISYDPDGAEVGTDGSTGFTGIKWNVSDDFICGQFSFTLDGDYDEGPVLVMAKAGPNSNTAVITGPVDPQCSDSTPPVPEVSTIIMLSLGLVALGGFVLIRRRKQGTVSA